MMISNAEVLTTERGEWEMAQRAREWFVRSGPADAPPLPLSYDEREALKHGGIDHIVALFARSLAGLGYNWEKHLSFYEYACGAMALRCLPWFVRNDPQLIKRFPPKPLEGLRQIALCWNPPARRKRAAQRTTRKGAPRNHELEP
jgi:hypothetical protein